MEILIYAINYALANLRYTYLNYRPALIHLFIASLNTISIISINRTVTT